MGGLLRSLPAPRMPAAPGWWPKLRGRLLIATVALLALLAAYMLWLRDSSLVAVERVEITGAEQSAAVERALRSAALEQSTLHLDVGALERAVASEPAVRSISANPDFPHGLAIDVELREPVGYLKGAGALLAGDGVILERSGERPEGIPAIAVEDAALGGGESVRGEPLGIARVLGATPAPLLALVDRATVDPDFGVLVELEGGLELRFGEVADADVKWRAVAAVLADPSFEGAAYLDLSVPDRPVAGGVAEDVEAAPIEPLEPVEPAAVVPAEPVEPVPIAPEAVPAPPAEVPPTGVE